MTCYGICLYIYVALALCCGLLWPFPSAKLFLTPWSWCIKRLLCHFLAPTICQLLVKSKLLSKSRSWGVCFWFVSMKAVFFLDLSWKSGFLSVILKCLFDPRNPLFSFWSSLLFLSLIKGHSISGFFLKILLKVNSAPNSKQQCRRFSWPHCAVSQACFFVPPNQQNELQSTLLPCSSPAAPPDKGRYSAE